MGYVEKLLGQGETKAFVARQHWIALLIHILSPIFTFLVFLAVGVVSFVPTAGQVLPLYDIVVAILSELRGRALIGRIWLPILIALFILGMGIALFVGDNKIVGAVILLISVVPLAQAIKIFLDWYNEQYIITNHRVISVKGVINKHVSDSALEKVNDVVLEQSAIGRMMGYGDVEIITGSDIGANLFRRIANPVRFKTEMLNRKGELVRHEPERPTAEPQIAAPAALEEQPAAQNIPALIRELDELRHQGVLSDEEFRAKKAELLERL
jgi:uncharacterized membrane protein YdbT with pleckstrin-like domain